MLVPLSPPPGLNSDDTTFGAEGRWADGSNCRFDGGRPQAIGGALSQFTLAGAGACYDLFVFSRSGTVTVAYGLTDALRVGSGIAAPSDRTPAGSPTAALGWSFAPWGNTLLAAIRSGRLYDQSETSAAAEVTEAPDRIDAGILVTDQRQVLALGTNEVGGTFNPMCIRISDIEDYSSAGSWTPTSTNNSDEVILPGSGAIIAGALVGPYVAVWTTAALFLGEFIGNPGHSYRFTKQADVCGPMSARSAVVMGGTAYWLTTDLTIMAWTPGAMPVAIPCPISRDFQAHFAGIVGDAEFKNHAVAMHRRREVWFFYGDSRDAGSANRYIAYSIGESLDAQRPVWFRGKMVRSAVIDSPLLYNPSDGYAVLAVDDDATVHIQDIDGQGTVPAGYIQTADQYIDDSQRRIMVRGIRLDFERQSSNISLTLIVRGEPRSTATTMGPHTISTSATKKDLRASGRLIVTKFSWIQSTDFSFRLGKPLFDVEPLGER